MRKKRSFIALLSITLLCIMGLIGLIIAESFVTGNIDIPVSLSGDSVENLNYVSDNSYRSNTKCYLTNDKFFYSVLDESDSNSFGSASKLVIYDLKSGEAHYPIDETKTPLSDIDNMYLIDDELLFTAYAYTDYYEDANWGFCLFSLNMNSYELKRIFQTPNTVDAILPCVIGDSLYYFASTMTLPEQELRIENEVKGRENELYLHSYQLHKYENGIDMLVKTAMPNYFDRGRIFADKSIESNIYFIDSQNQVTAFNMDGEEIAVQESTAKKVIEKSTQSNDSQEPENNQLFAQFGDYRIVYDNLKKLEENDCSYKYKCTYYLEDSKSNQRFKLSEGVYWYYYL